MPAQQSRGPDRARQGEARHAQLWLGGRGEPGASRHRAVRDHGRRSTSPMCPTRASAQSMTDMITGRLEMQFATIAPSLPNIRAGQLRALVTSGKTRAAVLPDVPTVAETGIAGYEAALWISFVAPPATPRGHRRAAQSRGERDSQAPPRARRRWSHKAWSPSPARPKRSPNASAPTSRNGAASWRRPAFAPSELTPPAEQIRLPL